jgi:hypothetical protein
MDADADSQSEEETVDPDELQREIKDLQTETKEAARIDFSQAQATWALLTGSCPDASTARPGFDADLDSSQQGLPLLFKQLAVPNSPPKSEGDSLPGTKRRGPCVCWHMLHSCVPNPLISSVLFEGMWESGKTASLIDKLAPPAKKLKLDPSVMGASIEDGDCVHESSEPMKAQSTFTTPGKVLTDAQIQYRQKVIDNGKATPEYKNYIALISKFVRTFVSSLFLPDLAFEHFASTYTALFCSAGKRDPSKRNDALPRLTHTKHAANGGDLASNTLSCCACVRYYLCLCT